MPDTGLLIRNNKFEERFIRDAGCRAVEGQTSLLFGELFLLEMPDAGFLKSGPSLIYRKLFYFIRHPNRKFFELKNRHLASRIKVLRRKKVGIPKRKSYRLK